MTLNPTALIALREYGISSADLLANIHRANGILPTAAEAAANIRSFFHPCKSVQSVVKESSPQPKSSTDH
jgi:hypothetical protein